MASESPRASPVPISTIRKRGHENVPPSGPQQLSILGQALSSHQKSPPDKSIPPSSAVSGSFLSPSTMSPSRHGAGWGPNHDLPRLPSVKSASQLPMSPSRASAVTMSISSTAVFEQSRNLLDKQRNAAEQERQSFAAERALWDIERQALYTRVQELEKALNIKNGLTPRKQGSAISPLEMGAPSFGSLTAQGDSGTSGSVSNGNGSRHTSTESDGDEFWRGAGARKGSVATRTFSDSSSISHKPEDRRLPSIAETESPRKSSAISTSCINTVEGSIKTVGSSDGGVNLGKDFDGIKFKLSGHPPENAILTPESPSPKQSLSPSRVSPGNIELPSNRLAAPDDVLTKNAGHTPLAGRTESTGNSSRLASNVATPTQEVPRHPRASVARPPTERSDSYFPPAPEDEDPELKGPLNLQNDGENDKAFLDELDSKLTNAAKSTTQEASETSSSENQDTPVCAEPTTNHHKFDQPEHEPKLRIRRSMNFGAPLGVGRYGKM
ncbi:MAG: hypothetical protein M1830_001835 [Pleopsidium flavum]|nr:MAG: hypothetical protein M1830_001835 [Pleopsidium flavum]